MIRRALPEDMDRLIEMGQRFVAETEYAGLIKADPERITETVMRIATNPDGAIFVSGNGSVTGMIAMLIYEHPFSGERMASEMAWWVEPEARGSGVKLLRAAEEWARERGAVAVQMVAPTERVGALYSRLGYKAFETSYQRRL